MKKLNKKGVTLIELIVSFALVATAVIYFYQTLSTVYDLYVTSRKETQEFVDKDYAMRIVDAYVNAKGTDYISNVCGKYIVCDDVDFTPGEINVITIKKGGKAWIKYYTVKKDTFTPIIESLYNSDLSSSDFLTKFEAAAKISFGENCIPGIFSKFDSDTIEIYNSAGELIYTYVKTYEVNKVDEESNLTNFLKKNGTIGLDNYCDDKTWCDSVDFVMPTENEEKIKIRVYRLGKDIINKDYAQADITGEVEISKENSNGTGGFFAFFDGYTNGITNLKPKNNVIVSSMGKTKTSYTFSKEYSNIKGLRVSYYTGTDGNYSGITEFLLVDENGNTIVSSGLIGLPVTLDGNNKYTWGPTSSTWGKSIQLDNVITKKFRLKVIVTHYGENTAAHSVYAAINSITPIY